MPYTDPQQNRAYQKQYREKNHDKARAYQERYRNEDKELYLEYVRQYYRNHREKILARNLKRYHDKKLLESTDKLCKLTYGG